METTLNTLHNDIDKLKTRLHSAHLLLQEEKSENKRLKAQNQYLLEQFRLAQQKQFGKSSEAHVGQGQLFNEAEHIIDETIESGKETLTDTRNKPRRQSLPKDLPREVIIHDIAEKDKICDGCGHALHLMGKDKSEQLEFIPAQIKVIEHVRLKYSCRTCEKTGINVPVNIAPVPATPIAKSMATPSLLSQIITSKYQYSLPLYRQEMLFKQHGIVLGRKTMSEWMLKCAALFKPIIDHWHDILLRQSVLQADETTLNVLSEARAKCYMWLYCSGSDSPRESPLPNIVLYDYQKSRHGQHAVDFLRGFSGYLQVDGYSGYEQLQATLVACWAHARRKFVEAEKAQGNHKTGKANWAICHIQKLYRIETLLKDKTVDEKHTKRQEEALPLLQEFKDWLDKSALQVPPQSAIGKAIAYSLNQWEKLIRYIEDGRLNIDNNRAERAVKPFVIGRKNWLFSNTSKGAQASAVLYSIIETAKANGLIPFHYIMLLLAELPKSTDNLEHLMPWNCISSNV